MRGRPRIARDFGDKRECAECKKVFTKELHFYKHAKSSGGYMARCKYCFRFGQKPYKRQIITETRAARVAAQPYCTICGATKEAVRLVTDHCHATGAFRTVLCYACNTGIGLFWENPGLLRRAAAYVEYWAEQRENAKLASFYDPVIEAMK